jgi:tetratricopeptide (TPR) repeat protein
MMKYCLATAFALLLAVSAAAQVPEPKLQPTSATQAQKDIIKEGADLHDKGDFDGAIARYEQVLKENPNDIEALYEMSFSYFAKKDYQKSLEISQRAAQYKSNLLPIIYGQIGNAFDELGDSKKALEYYKAALKLDPSLFLVHFNMAVMYARAGKLTEARESCKQSALLNPNYGSAQRLMGAIFDKDGYRVPALLASSRFLILEPNTKRSEAALQAITKIMEMGVSDGGDGKNIHIFMDPKTKKDEGDFDGVTLLMSLMKAADLTEENKKKSEWERRVHNFETLFAVLGEQKTDKSKFTWKFYAPYFVEMKAKGHVEAFVYYIHQSSSTREVGDWLNQNRDKVASFLSWSKAYAWPRS